LQLVGIIQVYETNSMYELEKKRKHRTE